MKAFTQLAKIEVVLLASFVAMSGCGRWETIERSASPMDATSPQLPKNPGSDVLENRSLPADEQLQEQNQANGDDKQEPEAVLAEEPVAKRELAPMPEVTLTEQESEVIIDWNKSQIPDPTPEMSEEEKAKLVEAKQKEEAQREADLEVARQERLAKEKLAEEQKQKERAQAIRDEQSMRDESARKKAQEERMIRENAEAQVKAEQDMAEAALAAERQQESIRAIHDERRMRDSNARKQAEQARLAKEKAERLAAQAEDVKRAQEIEKKRILEQRLAEKKRKVEEARKYPMPRPRPANPTPAKTENEVVKINPNEQLPFSAPAGAKVIERGELIPTVYYYPVHNEDEKSCVRDTKIYNASRQVMIEVCEQTEKKCRMQGSCGIIQNGKYRAFNTIDVRSIGGIFRYFEITKSGCQYGYGTGRICLDPYYTLAADQSLYKAGQVVYIPLVRGLVLPDGSKHTGFFIIRDMGAAIKGKGRFDFFAGMDAWYDRQSPFAKLGLTDVRMSRLYKARYGRPVEYFLLDGETAQQVRSARAFPKYPSHQSVTVTAQR